MKAVLIILAPILFLGTMMPAEIIAQDITLNQSTLISPHTRYEIVQSSIGAKWTFKVDKYKGNVYQLVSRKNGYWTWKEIKRIAHRKKNVLYDDDINYQIFVSGIASRFIFLMNIHSGATWQLMEDKQKGTVAWVPFER